jgi:hypothetical protein
MIVTANGLVATHRASTTAIACPWHVVGPVGGIVVAAVTFLASKWVFVAVSTSRESAARGVSRGTIAGWWYVIWPCCCVLAASIVALLAGGCVDVAVAAERLLTSDGACAVAIARPFRICGSCVSTSAVTSFMGRAIDVPVAADGDVTAHGAGIFAVARRGVFGAVVAFLSCSFILEMVTA